ncbi:MAG TPA: thermonuclease family protein [Pyrinomonadaceae bacterium]|nr:thermonuclease family protein [Pyrinomonadaceae bacterium]
MSHYHYDNCRLNTETTNGGVIDGDTVDLLIVKSVGFGVDAVIKTRMRLNGIDTPELRGGTDETKAAARQAKARLAELLTGRVFTVVSHKTSKYGLWLADIYTNDGVDVNKILLDEGLAVPYFGGTK